MSAVKQNEIHVTSMGNVEKHMRSFHKNKNPLPVLKKEYRQGVFSRSVFLQIYPLSFDYGKDRATRLCGWLFPQKKP